MILSDPYDFQSLKLSNASKHYNDINKYISISYMFIKNKEKVKIKPFTNEYVTLNPVILYGLSDLEKDIPTFKHPVINKEYKWIALDLRNAVKLNDTKEDYEIKNSMEYHFRLYRFMLTGLWSVGKQHSLYNLKLPHIAFGNWISENLTRKFGLDLNTQIQLKILAYIYYDRLFTNNYTSEDFAKLIIRLKDDIFVQEAITNVYEKIQSLENIDDFCKACYDVTGNIRLKNLTFDVLINIFANSWMSIDGKEIALLALEHPPTWISMVYMSTVDRLLSKSNVGNTVSRMNRKNKIEEFSQSFDQLIRELKQDE